MFDDRGGNFGPVLRRGGRPVERAKGAKTPCAVCPKIPAGRPPDPLFAVEMEPWMVAVYRWYRECKAVGEFPRDGIVRHFAAVISAVEQGVEQARSRRDGMMMLGTLLNGA